MKKWRIFQMSLTEREKWLMCDAYLQARIRDIPEYPDEIKREFEFWIRDNEHKLAHEAPTDHALNILKGSLKCLEREVQLYRITLEGIERHRGSTFWPQNETVESMAESAKQTLIDLGAWD